MRLNPALVHVPNFSITTCIFHKFNSGQIISDWKDWTGWQCIQLSLQAIPLPLHSTCHVLGGEIICSDRVELIRVALPYRLHDQLNGSFSISVSFLWYPALEVVSEAVFEIFCKLPAKSFSYLLQRIFVILHFPCHRGRVRSADELIVILGQKTGDRKQSCMVNSGGCPFASCL